MNSKFAIAGVVGIVYVILKFLEIRFITKETKPVKEITRDALLVYISSVLALFVIEQADASEIGKTNVAAFVGSPDF